MKETNTTKDTKDIKDQEIKEIKNIDTTVEPEFDGFMDMMDFDFDGKTTSKRVKFYLSTPEQKKFMGDNDPSLYFRLGKVPVAIAKDLGKIIDEDRLEYQVFSKLFVNHPKCLLFKHDMQNIYTILVPKTHSELEKDANGEYSVKLSFCDARSIVFSGKGDIPGSFTEDYFTKRAGMVLARLDNISKILAQSR